jgi:predicted permease
VSPGYFATLGSRIIAGRDFSAGDIAGAERVLVVGETFAKRAWPNEPAVGKRLLTEGTAPIALTVVGVVPDLSHSGLQGAQEQPDVYVAVFQSPPRSPSLLTLFVRTTAPAPTVVNALRPILRDIDPNLPFYDVQTMEARLGAQTSTGRFLVTLMGAFGVLGLILATVGVYGVIAYTVAQRTREIGIRMALGATRSTVMWHVMLQTLVPVVAGVAVGYACIWYLQRFVTSLLYGVSALDPATLIGAPLLLIAMAMLATCAPAQRAARIQPVTALRNE